MVQEDLSDIPHVLIFDWISLFEDMPVDQFDTRREAGRALVHPFVVVVVDIHKIRKFHLFDSNIESVSVSIIETQRVEEVVEDENIFLADVSIVAINGVPNCYCVGCEEIVSFVCVWLHVVSEV